MFHHSPKTAAHGAGGNFMFTIKIKTEYPLKMQEEQVLQQTAAETGERVQCSMEGTNYTFSGDSTAERLAYLFGTAVGSCRPYAIVSLLFAYEKSDQDVSG